MGETSQAPLLDRELQAMNGCWEGGSVFSRTSLWQASQSQVVRVTQIHIQTTLKQKQWAAFTYSYVCIYTQTDRHSCVRTIITNKEEVTDLSVSEDKGGAEMRRGENGNDRNYT